MENNTHEENNFITIQLLKSITQETYRVALTIIFILGIIGHLLNVRLFTRSTMIKNSCCNYFLASSCIDLIRLFFSVFVRMLDLGYNINTREFTIDWWCKIRLSITCTTYLISSVLNTLASFDRYASSCRQSRYRNFCQTMVARRIIPIVIVLVCISNSHMSFNLVIVNGKCWTRPGWYQIIYDIFFMVMYNLCYPLLSGIFALLTIRNMRRCHIAHAYKVKIKDFQRMILTHLICFILLTMPFTIHKLYNGVTIYYPKDLLQHEWENLSQCIVSILCFANDASGFYLYSLSSRKFRREFLASISICKPHWSKEKFRYLPRFIVFN
ncbi:unnamed protein product [Rotaria sp. Silwood2]|nr:unnamed protein product [Rotaria sp. Silwood2]